MTVRLVGARLMFVLCSKHYEIARRIKVVLLDLNV